MALLGRDRPGTVPPAPPTLPPYTVLGPLLHEAERAATWTRAVEALEYPKHLLDVQVLVEEDDRATRRAAREEIERRGRPPLLRLVVVPAGEPRTKPRALMHGLTLARGDLLVVCDAEDVPDRDQLIAAAGAFATAPADVACLQARLVISEDGGGVFERLMAADYRLWHGGFLPGLARLRAPVPLAGTSNHLRVGALRALGGWDPWNVAEDADLGIRLARAGFATRTLPSRTLERSTPSSAVAWVRQRSRWSKGFAQTWVAAARTPLALVRELGWGRAACLHLTLAGTLALQLATPVLWASLCGAAATRLARPSCSRSRALDRPCLVSLAGGTALRLASLRALRGTAAGLGAVGLAAPLYWALEGVAAWRGLCQLAWAPSRWEKTDHPVDGPARVTSG